jgi:hypothetical protein
MDSARVPGGDQRITEARLVQAVKAIRSINMMRNVPIVLAVECLPGPIGPVVAYQLDQYRQRTGDDLGGILIMREYGPNRAPGVPKTNESTRLMLDLSREQMRYDRVYFSEFLKVGDGQTVEGNIIKLMNADEGLSVSRQAQRERHPFGASLQVGRRSGRLAHLGDDDRSIGKTSFGPASTRTMSSWRNRMGARGTRSDVVKAREKVIVHFTASLCGGLSRSLMSFWASCLALMILMASSCSLLPYFCTNFVEMMGPISE